MFSWVINFTYDMAQCRERGVDSDLRKVLFPSYKYKIVKQIPRNTLLGMRVKNKEVDFEITLRLDVFPAMKIHTEEEITRKHCVQLESLKKWVFLVIRDG